MNMRYRNHRNLNMFGTMYLLLLYLLLFISYSPSAHAETPDQIGQWGPVLDWQYQGKHMVLLPNSKVLVFRTGDTARVWDPDTNTFIQTPALFGDLHCAGQVTLADGRVIVIGGQNGAPHVGTSVTSLFDPFTNSWSQGSSMAYERWYATATTLPDGRVLATSGDDATGTRITIPEIYDPVADTWTQLTGANRAQGLYPFMFVLPNGKAYEAGTGTDTWILDYTGTGSWTQGPTNAFGSSGYAESGATYAPGKFIRSGGNNPAIANTAIIDMTAASPQWKQVSPMAYPRRRHNMVLLVDGSVMAVGGTASSDSESAAVLAGEIWNPATEQWSTVAAASEGRAYHSAALTLPDGRVIWAGGEMSGSQHAQIYSPPFLFKGPRPSITDAPDTVSYGSSFTVTMADATVITGLAFMRPSAVTHAYDHNQRYVPTVFTQTGSSLTVTAPGSGSIAPPGYYMLIAKDTNGIPSVAQWVRIGANLQPGTITGQVTDSDTAAGIAGATVSYSGGSTTADQNGQYTLNNVQPGEHLVTAAASGYANLSKPTNVTAAGTTTQNFALSKPGSITGKVTDTGTGNAIAGATITYSGGTVTTDANGNYTIASIASGSQSIQASATGYVSAQQNVTVPPNGSVTANFTLSTVETFIGGEVRDSVTQSVIVGATVSYSGGSTTTDSLGRYRLDNVAPGTYDVTVSASGYNSATHQVVVLSGQYATSDFAIDPTGGGTVQFVQTVSGSSSGSNTVTSAEITGVSGHLYLAAIATRTPVAVSSMTGLGLTWTRVDAQCAGRNMSALELWKAQGTPTASGVVTANLAASAKNAVIAVSRYSGVSSLGNPLSGNTRGVDGVCSGGVDSSAYSFNLSTTTAGAMVYGTVTMRNKSHTAGAGYTERIELATGSSGDIVSVATQDKLSPITVLNGSFSGSVDWAVIGLVLNPGGVSPPQPPIINSFTPASGPVSSTAVTITGSNFTGASAVAFNGTAASFTVNSDTQITATVPVGATSGPISVTSPGGTGTSTSNFTVTTATVQHSLTVSVAPASSGTVGLSPPGGVYEQGTVVTLTAMSAAGYQFSSWSGDLSGAVNPTSITMDADKSVTANFTANGGGGSVTHMETVTGGSTSSTTVSTAADVTAVSGHLYLAAISTKPNVAVSSVSGLGLSWTLVKAQCAGRSQTRIEVWKAQGVPVGGPVTAALSTAPGAAVIAVSRYSGATAIGNIVSGNTVGPNGACSGGVDSSSYSVNLATTVDNAVAYGAVAIRSRTNTPGTGYSERAEVFKGTSGNIAGAAVEDKTVSLASTVPVNGTLSSISDWAVISLEILP